MAEATLIHAEFTNLEETLAKLGTARALVATQVFPAELHSFAEEIMAISKEEVPVKWGNLRATGHVESPVVTTGQVDVALGYGGPAVDYAIHVHERLELRHTVGKAKYLEDPLTIAVGLGRLDTRLANALEREFVKLFSGGGR